MRRDSSLLVQCESLTFRYPNGTVIFDNFSWQVQRGESWAIVGPSGCGKSTLLYLIAGLRQVTDGALRVDGQVLARPRPQTGLILQDYGLLPWATVRKNAALGLNIRRFYGPDGKHSPTTETHANLSDSEQRVDTWLARLNIAHIAGQYPTQISGGQRQRVAIARTLALTPDLLLMDEPFGALDTFTREDLQNLTLELQQEQHLSLILVTHNMDEAVFLGRRILVLGQPPNSTPVIVENPQAGSLDYRTHPEFMQQINCLRGMLAESPR